MKRLLSLSALLLIGAPACTAITGGTDNFQRRMMPLVCGASPVRADARLEFLDMNAHQANLFTAEVVRIEGIGPARMRRLVGRVVYDPLADANLEMLLPCSVVPGNHEVDVWADLGPSTPEMPNGNRMYDRSPVDHQWRLMLQGDGTVSYRHDVDFIDVVMDAPMPRGALPVVPILMNMEPFEGLMLHMEVRRVTPERNDEVILVYRRQEVDPTVFRGPIRAPFFEGLIELRGQYQVAVWIDLNDNGVYDPPGGEGRDYATLIAGIGEPPAGMDPGGLQVVFNGTSPPPATDVRF